MSSQPHFSDHILGRAQPPQKRWKRQWDNEGDPIIGSDASTNSGRTNCSAPECETGYAPENYSEDNSGSSGESIVSSIHRHGRLHKAPRSDLGTKKHVSPRPEQPQGSEALVVATLEASLSSDNAATDLKGGEQSDDATELSRAPYFDYVDHSRDDIDPLVPLAPPLRMPNFPAKMHAILSRKDLKDVVAWMPHGRSFKILDAIEFEIQVIPVYFEHGKIASFNRQANNWGFKRMTKGRDRGSYYNEYFLRGLPNLSAEMKRPGLIKKKETIKELEPDLFEISAMHPIPQKVASDSFASIMLKAINVCHTEGGPKARMPLVYGGSSADVSLVKQSINSDERKCPRSAQQYQLKDEHSNKKRSFDDISLSQVKGSTQGIAQCALSNDTGGIIRNGLPVASLFQRGLNNDQLQSLMNKQIQVANNAPAAKCNVNASQDNAVNILLNRLHPNRNAAACSQQDPTNNATAHIASILKSQHDQRAKLGLPLSNMQQKSIAEFLAQRDNTKITNVQHDMPTLWMTEQTPQFSSTENLQDKHMALMKAKFEHHMCQSPNALPAQQDTTSKTISDFLLKMNGSSSTPSQLHNPIPQQISPNIAHSNHQMEWPVLKTPFQMQTNALVDSLISQPLSRLQSVPMHQSQVNSSGFGQSNDIQDLIMKAIMEGVRIGSGSLAQSHRGSHGYQGNTNPRFLEGPNRAHNGA